MIFKVLKLTHKFILFMTESYIFWLMLPREMAILKLVLLEIILYLPDAFLRHREPKCFITTGRALKEKRDTFSLPMRVNS